MRPGPPRGDAHELPLTVTDALAAPPAPGVPAVCTTAALVEAGERACRDLLTPHLESGEVVVVTRQDLSLRAPIPAGVTVSVTATVALVTPTSVTYEILVRHATTMVARGSLEHRLLEARTLADEVAARAAAPTA